MPESAFAERIRKLCVSVLSDDHDNNTPADVESANLMLCHLDLMAQPSSAANTFVQDLEAVINRHSKENGSDTPDFILAQYLEGCLATFDTTMVARERWYGRGVADGAGLAEGIEGVDKITLIHCGNEPN